MKLFVVLCFIGAALAIPNPFTPPMEKATGLVIPDEYYCKGYSKGYSPSQTHSLHQWKKPLDWLFQMNTTVKDTARDTAHHITVKVTAEDTFHTADQPTTQEESSVAELVVTEEDTTRDVTPQSSTTAK